MGRPRKHDGDLPRRVYFRHGAFWHVINKRWTRLGVDRAKALQLAARIDEATIHSGPEVLRRALLRAFKSRRADAAVRGIPFQLTAQQVVDLAEATQWRCAVTGVTFSMKRSRAGRHAALSPSIDRIEPALGYVPGNVRVVCLATNFAMNEWGDEVMHVLAEGWMRKQFKEHVVLDDVQKSNSQPAPLKLVSG